MEQMSEDDFKTFFMFGLMLFVWMILDAKFLRPNFPIYAQLTS
jgi:hypothetical protein